MVAISRRDICVGLTCALLAGGALFVDFFVFPPGLRGSSPEGLGVIVAVGYFSAVLGSLWLPRWQHILCTALAVSVLILVVPAYVVMVDPAEVWGAGALARRLVGLVPLWFMAIVAIQHRRGAQRARELIAGLEDLVAERTTQFRQAEEEARAATERLNEAQRLANIGSWQLDLNSNELIWSDEIYRIFGIDSSKFGGSYDAFLEAIHPEDRASVNDAYTQSVRNRRPYAIEHRLLMPDGSVKYVHERCETFYDASGNAVRSIGTVQDITERRLLEERLRQSQKLEAVGHLTGGIAHDFNNLLTVILGNLELIDEASGPDDSLRSLIQDASHAAYRGAQLTQRLLAFSRKQQLEPAPVSVNRLVAEIQPLLERTLGEEVTFEMSLADGLWLTEIDSSQFENSLLNLAVNAKDAMPRGGVLSIESSNITLNASLAASHSGLIPGNYVLLKVSDTGAGMAGDVLGRVFELLICTQK